MKSTKKWDNKLTKFGKRSKLRDFELLKIARERHDDAFVPGVYIIWKQNHCIYVGSASKRKNKMGIVNRLHDLFSNSHTLSYRRGKSKRHGVQRSFLKKCHVQWLEVTEQEDRSLLEHYAIVKLRPKHFDGDKCSEKK